MSWDLRVPIFDDGPAAEELSHEVTEEVAEDAKHDCVGGVSKSGAYAE